MTAPPRPGEVAPDLSAPTIDGQTFDLRDRDAELAYVCFLRHAG